MGLDNRDRSDAKRLVQVCGFALPATPVFCLCFAPSVLTLIVVLAHEGNLKKNVATRRVSTYIAVAFASSLIRIMGARGPKVDRSYSQ